jgi:hypothetical protein
LYPWVGGDKCRERSRLAAVTANRRESWAKEGSGDGGR